MPLRAVKLLGYTDPVAKQIYNRAVDELTKRYGSGSDMVKAIVNKKALGGAFLFSKSFYGTGYWIEIHNENVAETSYITVAQWEDSPGDSLLPTGSIVELDQDEIGIITSYFYSKQRPSELWCLVDVGGITLPLPVSRYLVMGYSEEKIFTPNNKFSIQGEVGPLIRPFSEII